VRNILIISPHFPPSNLAGVHRSRLFAQHLPSFGWKPIILTVHEKYYEEKLDDNLLKLLGSDLRIEKVKAFPVGPLRIIGDIGLRGFFQLYRKAKEIITSEKIDFLYIPIPSFYTALLGRLLHTSTGIHYGIDYIDPWVHQFPGSEKIFSRHWFSTKLALILEPVAVKKASLITGVAEGYYKGVIERNPELKGNCIFGAMPYGGEEADHNFVRSNSVRPYLFPETSSKYRFVYAGAMLPRAYEPLENIFHSIHANRAFFENTEFHFIGSGKKPDDPKAFNIKPLAEKYGLWQEVIFEYPTRIPYLDVLSHLKAADAIFILGSTEPHYTPSKVYQAVLSGKPIFAVLHTESSAVPVLKDSRAGIVLEFADKNEIEERFLNTFSTFKSFTQTFIPENVQGIQFQKTSANSITKKLANLLRQVFE
jgi:hypothetical protein